MTKIPSQERIDALAPARELAYSILKSNPNTTITELAKSFPQISLPTVQTWYYKQRKYHEKRLTKLDEISLKLDVLVILLHRILSDPRTTKMLELRLRGETLATIGKEFHLTRERVRQILSKYLKEEK